MSLSGRVANLTIPTDRHNDPVEVVHVQGKTPLADSVGSKLALPNRPTDRGLIDMQEIRGQGNGDVVLGQLLGRGLQASVGTYLVLITHLVSRWLGPVGRIGGRCRPST